MSRQIRKVIEADVPQLKKIIDSTELFPSHMLDDMISDYLRNEASNDIWFTALENKRPISVGYCAPERLTEGTYNLYAIGVDKKFQGQGIGMKMMSYIENVLRENGQRILIVETSGQPMFELTREFYVKCNYVKQANIPEFYEEGDDKIVFWKKLN